MYFVWGGWSSSEEVRASRCVCPIRKGNAMTKTIPKQTNPYFYCHVSTRQSPSPFWFIRMTGLPWTETLNAWTETLNSQKSTWQTKPTIIRFNSIIRCKTSRIRSQCSDMCTFSFHFNEFHTHRAITLGMRHCIFDCGSGLSIDVAYANPCWLIACT